ncbi:MAG: hypothetical protein EPO28_08745 [Saprospiraceae bacterium]|nr:MAG: hypothetical protein EPO28_08745 [Saprospiraceae bacterium]
MIFPKAGLASHLFIFLFFFYDFRHRLHSRRAAFLGGMVVSALFGTAFFFIHFIFSYQFVQSIPFLPDNKTNAPPIRHCLEVFSGNMGSA